MRKVCGEKETKATLAAWEKKNFRLDCVPTQLLLSKILKDGGKIVNASESACASVKRHRSAAAPGLEEVLFQWACIEHNKCVIISGELIKLYALKL